VCERRRAESISDRNAYLSESTEACIAADKQPGPWCQGNLPCARSNFRVNIADTGSATDGSNNPLDLEKFCFASLCYRHAGDNGVVFFNRAYNPLVKMNADPFIGLHLEAQAFIGPYET